MVLDGGNGGASGRRNKVKVESGMSSSKQARKRTSNAGKGRRLGGGYADILHYGLVGWRLEMEEAIKHMINDLDGATGRLVGEYGRISEEFPAAFQPLIKRTFQKHEAAIMGVMEEHKAAIMTVLETKGVPAEEYLAAMEVILEEFELALNKHMSKKYLVSLLCKAAAEQMTEAVRRRLQG